MGEKGFVPEEARKSHGVEQIEPAGPSLEVTGFETSPMSNQEVESFLSKLNPFLTKRFLVEKVAFVQTSAIRGRARQLRGGEATWDEYAHSQTIKIFSTFNEVGKGDEILDSLTPKEKLQWGLSHEVGGCIFRLIDAIERRKGFLEEIADRNQHDELLMPLMIAKQHLLTYYTAAVFFLPPITKYAEIKRGEEQGKQPQEWAIEDFSEAYAMFKVKPEELKKKSEYRFRATSLIDKLAKGSEDEIAKQLDSILEEIKELRDESLKINREGQVKTQG